MGLIYLSIVLVMGIAVLSGCDGPDTTAPLVASAEEPSRDRVQPVAVTLGEPAPKFRLRDLAGNTVSLESYRGTVVMVNFWATWCGPCRVEMPAMETLYRTFARRDFEILAVSTDPQGAAVTKPFRQEMGLSFPILHDADYHVGLIYGARTLPMTFIVDRQGILRQRIFGARDWASPEAVRLIRNFVGATRRDG
jgi:peroxiredoxin